MDDSFALIGSANLDLRSFNLDFELSVMLYGQQPNASLVELQSAYIKQSTKVNVEEWRKRKPSMQYRERIVAMTSPLLVAKRGSLVSLRLAETYSECVPPRLQNS